jgi:hypothetical protein|tara:strand:- start:609 stop:785 length:177 start_codon:yes stop_codon:yes gene_type:complete
MIPNTIRIIKDFVKEYVSDCEYGSFKDLTDEDIDFISSEMQASETDIREILGLESNLA